MPPTTPQPPRQCTPRQQVPRQNRRTNAAPTRSVTLHRLLEGSTLDNALDFLDDQALERVDWHLDSVDLPDSPGVFVHANEPARPAPWCAQARITTGVDVRYTTRNAGGLLILQLDGDVYAISYGKGHLWLKDEVKDPRFGLNYAIRSIDADQILDLVRRLPGARGRTDSTLVPGGTTIWSLGIERHAEVVRRIGGLVENSALTFARTRGRSVKVDGATGLHLRLGVQPADLVSDLREIAAVCRQQAPHPDLAFVENITPVASRTLIADLTDQLDALLGEITPDADRLTVAVPDAALPQLPDAHAFAVRIGNATTTALTHLRREDLLHRTRLQPAGRRVDTLRAGRVTLLADDDGQRALGGSSALKWIEATGSVGPRRFFLMEGQWYELGATYLDDVRDYVGRLLGRGAPTLDLPAWRPDMVEKDYNLHVADVRPGQYVCLDRRGVTTRLHRTHGVEICDLLGPNNELIHVKHASGSAPLSHLFAQGQVAAETLNNSPEARRTFSNLVRAHGWGRTVPEDFTPKKVVYAILLKQGEDLTLDTLFPFSQVTLRRAAVSLEGKAEVEVIPIRMAA
jgi:uncharacterized protein (TIGR04141 family)